MSLEEIKKWLEDNKDDEAVKAYLSAMKGTQEVSKESVEKYLVTEEGKALLKSKTDQACTNAIDTFKQKTMPDLIKQEVEKKIKEINPEETPEQKALREANERIDKLERNNKQERLEKIVLKTFSAKKLSAFSPLVNLFVGDDEEGTLGMINTFEGALKKVIEEAVTEALPGRKPKDTTKDTDPTLKNPFSKEHFNLTEQGRIYREDPDLAARLQQQAG